MPVGTLGASRVSMADLLQVVYGPRIIEQFNRRRLLLEIFGTKLMQGVVQGQEMEFKLHAAGGPGHSYSRDLQLAAAGHQKPAKHTFTLRFMSNRIEIDGDLLEDTANKQAAVVPALDFETKNLVKDFGHDMNFDLYGDGSGKIQDPATATSATVLTVENLQGLRTNMKVDIIKHADGSTGSGVKDATISVNTNTKEITLTDKSLNDFGDLNTNVSDYRIYRRGSRNDAPFGLEAIVSKGNPPAGVGNVGGIDRTVGTNDFYRAHEFDNGGVPRKLTFPLMQDVLDQIDQFGADDDNEGRFFVCGHRVWMQGLNELASNKMYDGERMVLNGWADTWTFGKIPVFKDKHCPADRMYCLRAGDFHLLQSDDGRWLDYDDGGILRRSQNFYRSEAAWVKRCQLMCDAPTNQAVITDLDPALPGWPT